MYVISVGAWNQPTIQTTWSKAIIIPSPESPRGVEISHLYEMSLVFLLGTVSPTPCFVMGLASKPSVPFSNYRFLIKGSREEALTQASA